MMKPRTSRVISEPPLAGRNKSETIANGPAVQRNQVQLNSGQQTSAQAIRKRRSSINVYDQPSSLNSRLRQLETDMLRLDEDRTKLFDDTHSVLAQYELKLNEIHAILKSRQDNVEKYVEDMKLLLQAKEEFEKQTKLLNEKNDRIHEKFMHRETTISREIKLLKNKFELLEKNRQFRSILQKSNNSNLTSSDNTNEDLNSGLDLLSESQRKRGSETNLSETDSSGLGGGSGVGGVLGRRSSRNVRVRMKLSKLQPLGRLIAPLFNIKPSGIRRKSNRVSSLSSSLAQSTTVEASTINDGEGGEATTTAAGQQANGPAGGESAVTKKRGGGLFGRLFG